MRQKILLKYKKYAINYERLALKEVMTIARKIVLLIPTK
jgi:hypothetical protein